MTDKMIDRLANRIIDNVLFRDPRHAVSQLERQESRQVACQSIEDSSIAQPILFDFHNDILTSDQSNQYKREYVVQQSQRVGLVLALWTSKCALTLSQVSNILQPYIDLGLPNIVLSIEDINIIDASPQQIAMLPFVFYGLVWNVSNRYAGSCYDTIGLSSDGVELVSTLCEHNKVVDVAHASKASFWDILDCTHGNNVVCSHTCFDTVHHHVRNLDDTQCQALVDNNSLIGFALVRDLLGGDDLNLVIRHIDWFVNKWGVDNLCIGTDYFGTNHLQELSTYEQVDTNIRNGLSKLGYANSDIDKILYNNLAIKVANYQSQISVLNCARLA
jgi:membrane dipeptidase